MLRRGLGWGRPLNVFASPLRRLCAGDGWRALLNRRCWRVGTLGTLRRGISFLRHCLLFPLRRRGPSLRCLLLIVLPHYGVTRLVTVILALKLLLLLDSWIPIP